jgi:hypothetical protein
MKNPPRSANCPLPREPVSGLLGIKHINVYFAVKII